MSGNNYPNIQPRNKSNQYPRGPSILDHLNPDSKLNKSRFRGFFNMMAIFASVFIFTKPLLNKIQNGYFLQPSLYTTFMNDYFLCILIWPLFFLWSFTSFLIQKFILMGLPKWMVLILQHSTQAGLFLFSTILILSKDWCSTHAAFVIIQACAHFMKMHSYTTVNRDYRQEYEESMRKNEKPRSNYPDNINVRDFVLFMWTPWLVYDTYPRKQKTSILYIIQKSAVCLACILASYIIHTQYIIPYVEMGYKISFWELLFREVLPGTILIIVLFYVTFQNITNIFAQITKLDYRGFYEEWWNSTTYEQFNRKWNKPVHMFFYRHLYLELIIKWKLSKLKAQLITFIFSAMIHEFLLAIIFRIVRPIFFGFIVGQVPLFYITKFMSGRKSGSYLFWWGIILGHGLIVVCYLRVHSEVTNLFTKV